MDIKNLFVFEYFEQKSQQKKFRPCGFHSMFHLNTFLSAWLISFVARLCESTVHHFPSHWDTGVLEFYDYLKNSHCICIISTLSDEWRKSDRYLIRDVQTNTDDPQ
jgi:hypothetical protein